MKIKEITRFLEQFAPLDYQESYDNCGLIVGDSDAEVDSALITLDCTEAVIDEAIEINCQLIIAHHPIIFSGLKKINGSNYIERTVIKAIKHNIAIYAIHTNLDNVNNGVSFNIAKKINLINCKVLLPKLGCENYGPGIIGDLVNGKDTLDLAYCKLVIRIKLHLYHLSHKNLCQL